MKKTGATQIHVNTVEMLHGFARTQGYPCKYIVEHLIWVRYTRYQADFIIFQRVMENEVQCYHAELKIGQIEQTIRELT